MLYLASLRRYRRLPLYLSLRPKHGDNARRRNVKGVKEKEMQRIGRTEFTQTRKIVLRERRQSPVTSLGQSVKPGASSTSFSLKRWNVLCGMLCAHSWSWPISFSRIGLDRLLYISTTWGDLKGSNYLTICICHSKKWRLKGVSH